MSVMPPSPFLNSAEVHPTSADTAAAYSESTRPRAAAGLFHSALEASLPAEPAAAPDLTDPPVAAADKSSRQKGGDQETPVVAEPVAAGVTDEIGDIGEIFTHARRLVADDDSYGVGPCMTNDLPIIRAHNEHTRRAIQEFERTHRFVLDEAAFMDELEEMPLFLRASGF